MKISVIVPIYQAESTLLRCVTSIEKALEKVYTRYQTEGEVILVNDGSTDHSSAMCKALAKKYKNILYIAEKRQGMASAKNAGLYASSGELICFVEAKDMVGEKYFIYLYREMKVDTALVVSHTVNSLSKQKAPRGKASRLRVMESPWLAMDEYLTREEISVIQGKLFRRDFIQYSFREDMDYLEDICFLADYLGCCKGVIKVVPEKEYYAMENMDISLESFDSIERAYQYVEYKMMEAGKQNTNELRVKYLHHFARRFMLLPLEQRESKKGKEIFEYFRVQTKKIHFSILDRALYMGMFIKPEMVGSIAKKMYGY